MKKRIVVNLSILLTMVLISPINSFAKNQKSNFLIDRYFFKISYGDKVTGIEIKKEKNTTKYHFQNNVGQNIETVTGADVFRFVETQLKKIKKPITKIKTCQTRKIQVWASLGKNKKPKKTWQSCLGYEHLISTQLTRLSNNISLVAQYKIAQKRKLASSKK